MSWLTRFPPRRGAVHHFPAKANHPHSVITMGSKLAPASSHRCDDRWKYYGEEVGLVARRKMVIPRCVIWPISVARIVPRDERASVQMTAASSGFIAIIYRRRNWRLAGSRQKRWFLQMHRILGDYYTARYWVLTVQSQYRMSLRLAKWTVVILQKETLSKLLSANTVTKKTMQMKQFDVRVTCYNWLQNWRLYVSPAFEKSTVQNEIRIRYSSFVQRNAIKIFCTSLKIAVRQASRVALS